MSGIQCHRCGRRLPEGALKYQVAVHVRSLFDGVIPETLEENGEPELRRLIREVSAYSEEELNRQVYEDDAFVLCPDCKEAFLDDIYSHLHPKAASGRRPCPFDTLMSPNYAASRVRRQAAESLPEIHRNMNLSAQAKYLFLFAHPDDEVLISGTMKLLLEAGAEIHAAWTTSGDKFTKREIRESELRRSTDILGLRESQTHLLRFPDLGMVAMLEEAADSATKLIGEIAPDIIFANAYEGGHPDHDSVNFLAYRSFSEARSFTGPI